MPPSKSSKKAPCGGDASKAVRTPRKDAAANRQRILDTASKLFECEDADTVSMNRIAQEAGIGAGTLYRHFSDKVDLCMALVSDGFMALVDELDELADETASGTTGNPRETLAKMLLCYFRFRESKIPLFQAMENAGRQFMGVTQSPIYSTVRGPFAKYFANAYGSNTTPTPEFRADALMSAVSGDFFRYQRVERQLTFEGIAAGIVDIFAPSDSSDED